MSILKKTADQLTVGESLKIQGVLIAAVVGVIAAPAIISNTYHKLRGRNKKDNASA